MNSRSGILQIPQRLDALLIIYRKVEGRGISIWRLLSETLVQFAVFNVLSVHVYMVIIINGCRIWNSMTSCPFRLQQLLNIYVVVV